MLEHILQSLIQNPRLITETYHELNQVEQENFCCDVLDMLAKYHNWPNYVSTDLVYVDTGYLASSLFFDKLFAPFRKNGVSYYVLRKYITGILNSVQNLLDAQRDANPGRDRDEITQDVKDIQYRMKIAFSGGLTPEQFSSKKYMEGKHFSYEFGRRFKVQEKCEEVSTKCDSLGVSIEDWLNGKYDPKPDDVVSDLTERFIVILREG